MICKVTHRVHIAIGDTGCIRLLQANHIRVDGLDYLQLPRQVLAAVRIITLLNIVGHDLQASFRRCGRRARGIEDSYQESSNSQNTGQSRMQAMILRLREGKLLPAHQQHRQAQTQTRQQIDQPETIPQQRADHWNIIIGSSENMQKNHRQAVERTDAKGAPKLRGGWSSSRDFAHQQRQIHPKDRRKRQHDPQWQHRPESNGRHVDRIDAWISREGNLVRQNGEGQGQDKQSIPAQNQPAIQPPTKAYRFGCSTECRCAGEQNSDNNQI